MEFNPLNFIDSLYYLVTGMISIFIVMGVIILVTMAINRIFRKKAE